MPETHTHTHMITGISLLREVSRVGGGSTHTRPRPTSGFSEFLHVLRVIRARCHMPAASPRTCPPPGCAPTCLRHSCGHFQGMPRAGTHTRARTRKGWPDCVTGPSEGAHTHLDTLLPGFQADIQCGHTMISPRPCATLDVTHFFFCLFFLTERYTPLYFF